MLRRRNVTGLMAAVFVLSLAAPAQSAPLTPREIYRNCSKAVVFVFATDGSSQGKAGTGSIISSDGLVITNAHVVARGSTALRKVSVHLKPAKVVGSTSKDLRRRYEARVLALNAKLDLALLKMTTPPRGLTVLPFVDPDAVEVGEPVVAIGHPETGGLWTLTTGTISAVINNSGNIPGKDLFQTDASINRGNSGGPLLNAYGQIVGINTSISRRAADGLMITDINFSLKSSVAVEWMKRRKLLRLAYVKPADNRVAGAGAIAQNTPKKSKQSVEVVEPDRTEEVADDPDFRRRTHETYVVSSEANMPDLEAKQLTKRRPYSMDDYIARRMREIKSLENMMDDMRGLLDRKRKSR